MYVFENIFRRTSIVVIEKANALSYEQTTPHMRVRAAEWLVVPFMRYEHSGRSGSVLQNTSAHALVYNGQPVTADNKVHLTNGNDPQRDEHAKP